jgi:dTDP-4-dehydrorhamnose reductase
MILLLGATGYIGQAFTAELRRRKHSFEPLSRKTLDYTDFDTLFDYVRRAKPLFLINAAGYTGSPNVDACEDARALTLQGNVGFPQMLSRVCNMTKTPWGHVSSGCIYSGAKVLDQDRGVCRVERNLSEPRLQSLFVTEPQRFYGFTESNEPNFSFHSPPCSFYSGTKALAEEVLRGADQCYIWRLRIPFDEFDHPRNYLSKIQHYAKVYNNVNSLSHRGDFVRACLDLWERRAAFGAYNVTNPGAVTTRQAVDGIVRVLKPRRSFDFWKNDQEFYAQAAKAPRSNCILDTSKLMKAGIQMRPIQAALDDALNNWQVTGQTLRMAAGLSERSEKGDTDHWLPQHDDANAVMTAQQWLRA